MSEVIAKMNPNTFRIVSVMRRTLAVLLVVVVVSLVLVQPVLACPTCKEAIAENGQSQEGLVRGYFWSIIFMMSMPFLIFGGLGYYFSSQVRRARAAELLETAGEAVVEIGDEWPPDYICPFSVFTFLDSLKGFSLE